MHSLRPTARTRPRRVGMTLAEMVTVVLIMGILAGVAQMRFGAGVSARQATALARRLAMDIEAVKRTARATSSSKSLVINSVAKTYTLIGVTNADRKSAANVVSLTESASLARFGTVNLGGDTTLVFNGFGLPDSGGTIEIVVGSTSRTVTVDASTGSATLP